jgi:membrane protein
MAGLTWLRVIARLRPGSEQSGKSFALLVMVFLKQLCKSGIGRKMGLMKSADRPQKWKILWSAAQLATLVYAGWRRYGQQKRRVALMRHDSSTMSPDSRTVIPVAATADTKPAHTGPAARRKKPAQRPRSHSTLGYLKNLGAVAIDAAKAWASHRAASKGAALALYTLFSLAPMLVLVVALAGYFLGEDAVRKVLLEQMQGLMGAQGADAIGTILQGSQRKSEGVMAGLVSGALVLVSATTAFAELKDSLDELWEVPSNKREGLWNLLRDRFLSFGLILVLVLMLLASLAVSAALAALSRLWGGAGADAAFELVSRGASSLLSFCIVASLFAVIFKYLPATKIAWKDVLVGALITAALFTVGKALITLYVARSNISSSYGAAGSVVVLITWIYYSAQIFFYGSLFTYEFAFQLGSRAHAGETMAPAPSSPEPLH